MGEISLKNTSAAKPKYSSNKRCLTSWAIQPCSIIQHETDVHLTTTLNESLAHDPPVVPVVGVSSDDEGPKMLKVSKSSRR